MEVRPSICALPLLLYAIIGSDAYCLDRIADNLHRPVALESDGDSLLVAEHRGIIRRVDLKTKGTRTMADLSPKLLTSSSWMDHRGLLSISVIDRSNRKSLLISSSRKSTENADHDTVITAIPIGEKGDFMIEEERELFRVPQPSNRYNGGQLLYQEGILFLTTGDGAMKYNESSRHDMGTLTGKVLRMRLADADGENLRLSKPEIFASGFRNPWRCAIDTRTDTRDLHKERLFCGDTAIEPHPEEEIYLVERGGKYGLPKSELSGNPAARPIHRYQLETGSAVIGGRVYHGKLLSELNEAFIFGDYVSGNIFALRSDEQGIWKSESLDLKWCGQPQSNGTISEKSPNIHVIAFAIDSDGELLVLADDKDKSGHLRGSIFSLRRSSSPALATGGLGKYVAIAFFYWVIANF